MKDRSNSKNSKKDQVTLDEYYDETDPQANSKRKKRGTLAEGSELEKEFGMLHQGSIALYKWLSFADEASKR